MRLPDFLGIGTQKGGTTSLHALMSQDERIGMPKRKELHYFDQDELEDVQAYAREFEGFSEKKLIGEITPYYIFHPKAAQRIKQTIPNVKIIALLRNPVERTISQYFHATRRGYENLELEAALRDEKKRLLSGGKFSHQKHSYIQRSIYEKQLAEYEKRFPVNQILVLKSEDLFEDTQATWTIIQEFLGIKPLFNCSKLPRMNSGKGEEKNVKQETRSKLRKLLNPTFVAVEERYGIKWD